MQQLRYQRVSSPTSSIVIIGRDLNAGQIRRAIARQMGTQWYNIEIGSLEHGSLYEEHDFVDIRKTVYVIQQASERHVPFYMVTTLPDMTDPTLDEPRVRMSCDHAITPDNLYGYVTVKLKDGEDEIKCFVCKNKWEMSEIIEKSMMENDEKIFWSNRISLNKIRKDKGQTECPKCRTYCERFDSSNKGVRCFVCTQNGSDYDFCWDCKQPWVFGHKCGKEGLQEILNTCGRKTMGYSNILNVPTHRVCPKCGALIEHTEACKQTQCHRCKESFCFVCLTMCEKGILQCTGYSQQCTVAPVQQITS